MASVGVVAVHSESGDLAGILSRDHGDGTVLYPRFDDAEVSEDALNFLGCCRRCDVVVRYRFSDNAVSDAPADDIGVISRVLEHPEDKIYFHRQHKRASFLFVTL